MATDDDEWKAEIERRVSALEDDDAKVHGVIAVAYEWATKWLQRWPWLSTITPLVIGVAGTSRLSQSVYLITNIHFIGIDVPHDVPRAGKAMDRIAASARYRRQEHEALNERATHIPRRAAD